MLSLLQHWIANNLFGIAFAINGVEMLLLNNMSTGCILLGGLFVYDIFWVFFTDVMVTVAKSFEAPIKRKLIKRFFSIFMSSFIFMHVLITCLQFVMFIDLLRIIRH